MPANLPQALSVAIARAEVRILFRYAKLPTDRMIRPDAASQGERAIAGSQVAQGRSPVSCLICQNRQIWTR